MILSVSNGTLSIGNPPKKLPGVFDSLDVGGELKIDTAEMGGVSGSQKTLSGWKDADVTFSGMLLDDPKNKKTRFDFLKEITKRFNAMEDGLPVMYQIDHPMINAWDINQVYFSGLKTSEDRTKQIIYISLSFIEDNPMARVKEERSKSVATAKEENKRQEPPRPQRSFNPNEFEFRTFQNMEGKTRGY